MTMTVAAYYDALLAAGQDPVLDPPVLREYMDGWDGQHLLDRLHPLSAASVLELGVGTGRLAVRVAPLCRRFLGVDVAPNTVARAAKNLATIPQAEVLCADFLTHRFDEKFEVIYSSLAWMHVEQKDAALERIAALLAPGGRFLLSIDKSEVCELCFGDMTVEVYPDKPNETERAILSSGLLLLERCETERAYIFITKRE